MSDMTIYNFDSMSEIRQWFAIDTLVLTGLANRSHADPCGDNTLCFSGFIEEERRAGYAAIQTIPSHYNLGLFDGLRLRVRGDSRVYSVFMRTWNPLNMALRFECRFKTIADQWIKVDIPFTALEPVAGPFRLPFDPTFDKRNVSMFGIMIAHKQIGHFNLEIDSISAYTD